ncbi:general stress protein [Bacillus sp. T33-2]|uniref:general stress protein n=1 Tax=Bacillus sp. T33-2 TaxID=2054168 RepID=UPI000C75D39C|nr:general stress protein [Bacillus sp. T33-2]PLR96070.1 general stress protein [Bacillus sp. T33-2]
MFEHEKNIVGVYDNEQDAIQAVEDLKRQGYSTDDISVIGKNSDEVDEINDATGTKTEEGLAAGAATGGVLGGLTGLLAGIGALAIPGIGPIVAAGPIAATLTGAAVGAGAGGLAGALVGMGIPEDEADRYEGYVKEGKILVLADRKDNWAGPNDSFGVTDTHDGTMTGRTGGTLDNDPLNDPLGPDNPSSTRFNNNKDF